MSCVTSGANDLKNSIDQTHFPGMQDRDVPIKPQVPGRAMFSYQLALRRSLGPQEVVAVSLHSGRTSSSNMDHTRTRQVHLEDRHIRVTFGDAGFDPRFSDLAAIGLNEENSMVRGRAPESSRVGGGRPHTASGRPRVRQLPAPK